MFYVVMGLALIALCLTMIRVALPAPDGTQARLLKHPGVAPVDALLATLCLGTGFLLIASSLLTMW